MIDIVVVGAGGFGREVLDVIEAHNRAAIVEGGRLNVVGVIDDQPSQLNTERLHKRGYKVIGGLGFLIEARPADRYVLGIGSPQVKALITDRLDEAGLWPQGVAHPDAAIGSQNCADDGVIICGGVQISTNVHLGKHTHINPNATIGHDAQLAEFVSLNPGAIVSGEVQIGRKTLVGAGAVILQNLEIGEDCVIGASACVTKDVPSGKTAVGVPARWAS